MNLVRTNRDTDAEIERMKIPIVYGPKEKYVTRLQTDPDLQKETQITLPRMSYEMTGYSYDAGRKQNSLLKAAAANNASRVASQYMGVPYDITFDLTIYTRTLDDGAHIVEQILPYFNPDFSVTINSVPQVGFLKDIPLILNSVSNDVNYEGNYDSIRYVTWTLNFTMKAYFFGPISTPKIIRKVYANIYNDPSLKAGYIVRINTHQGNNGTFKVDDLVYQGENQTPASAYGVVVSWGANTGKLTLGSAQGQFTQNSTIKAVSTNASYNIASFDAGALKLVEITVEPNPIDAEPEDDYGFTTTITEWPNIDD
jgi:hypothetical protein